MPETDYYDFYRPSYELHLKPDGKKNCNSREYLENVMCHVIENIRHLPGAPSVQMQELPPRDMISAALRLPSDPDAAARNFTHQANNEDDENEE